MRERKEIEDIYLPGGGEVTRILLIIESKTELEIEGRGWKRYVCMCIHSMSMGIEMRGGNKRAVFRKVHIGKGGRKGRWGGLD